MRTAKFIAVTALFTALLIAAQFALSGVAGVELVTVLLLSFSFATGIRYGVTGAACFSLLRCFLFGFYPTVIILYLIYYPSFALFFGFLGNKSKRKITPALFVAVVIFAAAFTACFSLLDDVITPLFFGFGKDAFIAYFYSSLPFMLTQVICAAVSVCAFFLPLAKVFAVAVKRAD